ncbi:hypothetical protein [Streptomyces sp. NPDC059708]|uniref:hypothetical protein n=1 Tax=Streptomyces sp. NPDC059708 TaxID=3346916 RepID=UPI00368C3ACB
MPDALDQMNQQAEDRKRGTGNRSPGATRNSREAERQRRQAEREKAAQEEAAREKAAREEAEREKAAREEAERESKGSANPQGAVTAKVRTRPTSMPFYPDSENEEFLWQVREAATARREQIPATAVLRLALRRLEQQMTPSEIVRELGGPVQTTGRMGRPRR